MNRSDTRGFTIIELSLAITFISIMLLFMVACIVQVTRVYNKGSSVRQINQIGRQVSENIQLALRYGAGQPIFLPDKQRFCTGKLSYVWNTPASTRSENSYSGPEGGSVQFAEVEDASMQVCNTPDSQLSPTVSRELISSQLSVMSFSIVPRETGALIDFSVVLATGGSNIPHLVDGSYTCQDVDASNRPVGGDNEFCAFGDFHSVVYSRKY